MPRFNVAIVGAGLCGLVFALALDKYAPDVEYQIYEATAELTTAGAGINMHSRTLSVLRELGLEQALLDISGNGESERVTLIYRKSDQRDAFTFSKADADHDDLQLTFHRGELQKLFFDRLLHPERIHLGKRFASYTQHQDPQGQVEVHFQDGSMVSCDVLVGTDGIKSGVRAEMYTQLADAAKKAGRSNEARTLESYIRAVFSGHFVYRGLFTRDPLADSKARPLNMSHLMIYCGKDNHVVTYPISKGRILNVAAVVTHTEMAGTIYDGPWTVDVPKSEVQGAFVGWEPEVENIMQNIGSWNKWAINMVKDLPTFVDGRAALVGDAAHSMTPFQASGAGQGFEDCLMLGILLGHPNVKKGNLSNILKIYDQFRRPVAQNVAELSVKSGNLQSLNHPELIGVTPAMSAAGEGITKAHLQRIADDLERLKGWRQGTTVMPDCQAALDQIQGLTESSLSN
ncbi:FAD/NAD-P-binding domain-containing protein [Trametes gibbosa]|nr:FAD/NAD-P-binding domain-containing protein [Trametes gibbosa]